MAIDPYYGTSKLRNLTGQMALTGGATPTQMKALTEAITSSELEARIVAEERGRAEARENEAIARQKEQDKAQERAAKVAGGAQLAGSAAQTYMTYKLLGGGTAAGSGVAGTGTATATAYALTTGEAVAYDASLGAYITSSGQVYSGPVGYSGYAVSEGGSTVVGGSTLGSLAVKGGAMALGGEVGQANLGPAFRGLGMGKTESKMAGGAVGGLVGGYVAGGFAVGGPVGAIMGATIGAGIGYMHGQEGTVICTELHRQGYLSDTALKLEQRFGKKVGKKVYKGYRVMADPVVVWMQKSPRFTKYIVAPLGIRFAKEVAHRLKPKEFSKGSLVGKAIIAFGVPLCRLVYKYKIKGGK